MQPLAKFHTLIVFFLFFFGMTSAAGNILKNLFVSSCHSVCNVFFEGTTLISSLLLHFICKYYTTFLPL